MPDFPTLNSSGREIQPDYGFKPKTVDSTIHFKSQGGYDITRAGNSRVPQTFDISYTNKVPTADRNTLKAFEKTVKVGAESFYWKNPEEAYGDVVWEAGHTYSVGDIVRPVAPNTHSYICTVGGASHATTEPVWPTTAGATVVDNAVTWKENTYDVKFAGAIDEEYVAYGKWTIKFQLVEQ